MIIFAAFASIVAVSCNKENETPVVKEKTTTFEATVEGTTKTAIGNLTETSASVVWKGEESISVVGAANYKFTGTAAETGETAISFSYTGEYNETDVAAAYPYNAAVAWDAATKTVSGLTLVASNPAVEGTFAPNAAVAVAVPDEDNTLNFKNAHSLIKVTVGNEKVSKVCVYTLGEKISGDFSVTYDEAGNMTVGEGSLTYSEVTGNIEKGKTYYIPVLPTTVAAGSFTLEYTIDGIQYTKSKSGVFNIERKKVYDMGTVEFETKQLTYTDYYLTISNDWLYPARYAVYCYNSSASAWYDMTPVGKNSGGNDVFFKTTIPDDTWTTIIFVRLNPDNEGNDWNNRWSQSNDLAFEEGKNWYKITDGTGDGHNGNCAGTWDTYTPEN